MRLCEAERCTICGAMARHADAAVFGSRVSDAARGGDMLVLSRHV